MTTRGAASCALLAALAGCGDSPPRFAAALILGGVEISADVLNQGARVYEMRCASCHGADGSGNGSAGRALKAPPRDFRAADFRYTSTGPGELPSDADLEATIRNGRIDNGMPAWNSLSAADVHAVIQYIKTFSPRWGGPGPADAKS
ncbi:MAG: cytochrome c [Nannocystaceae bacterium]|nr:cytochrome c [Nannocystaceae bacterium]